MTKFRWHRGSLLESLQTTVEVKNRAALIDELRRVFSSPLDPLITDATVRIKAYGYDARTGWDTHIVTVSGKAVGFTDGPIQC